MKPIATRTDEQRKWMREWKRSHRPKNPKRNRAKERAGTKAWKAANREKVLAQNLLNRAIRFKRIIRPNQCEKCKAVAKTEGHHTDYSKPLEVAWLCRKCHRAEHRME